MTPEERALLERSVALSQENNEMLRAIRRQTRWSLVLKIFYWVLIIGLSVGAFYFIQPFLNAITGSDQSSGTSYTDTLKSLLK